MTLSDEKLHKVAEVTLGDEGRGVAAGELLDLRELHGQLPERLDNLFECGFMNRLRAALGYRSCP